MAKSLYGAYTAAGKAGGAYKASLYDIEAVGYEKEHSQQMYEIGEQKRENVIGAITEGVSLASNIYGGIQARKEFGEAQTAVQTGMAKTAYEESVAGVEGATEWSKLGECQSEWMGKFTPSEKPQAWHEKLFGADKEVRFGKKVEGEEGQDLSKYYSKSDILAERLSASALDLSKKTGSYIPPINLGGKEPDAPSEVTPYSQLAREKDKWAEVGAGRPKKNIVGTDYPELPESVVEPYVPYEKTSEFQEQSEQFYGGKLEGQYDVGAP